MLEKSNYKINSEIDLGDGPINGQGVGQISKCRYGFFPASFNACEMIAIYNLLILNGYKGHKFAEICLEMYPKTWALWGILGSNVYMLHKYFTKRNIPVKRYFAFQRDKCFHEIDKHKFGIISFWNRKNPFKGIHTVCVEKTESGYKVYNRYNNKDYPYEYKTAQEVVDTIRFLAGYII
ncbi:MAG: hypothetical protein IKL10_11375 [Clostridia bacterium]|nr:hypothetical protein [Clostridia bacterium]